MDEGPLGVEVPQDKGDTGGHLLRDELVEGLELGKSHRALLGGQQPATGHDDQVEVGGEVVVASQVEDNVVADPGTVSHLSTRRAVSGDARKQQRGPRLSSKSVLVGTKWNKFHFRKCRM